MAARHARVEEIGRGGVWPTGPGAGPVLKSRRAIRPYAQGLTGAMMSYVYLSYEVTLCKFWHSHPAPLRRRAWVRFGLPGREPVPY